MLREGGYAIIVDPNEPRARESSTFTCVHCNRIVFVKPFVSASDAGGFCRLCYKPVCGPCVDHGECVPFEAKLEAIEKRGRMLRSLGL